MTNEREYRWIFSPGFFTYNCICLAAGIALYVFMHLP